jgi:uncharacterized LabA/DUF88 family protein
MKKIIEKELPDKIVLVSGDGDYIKLVRFLIEKKLLKKILFPNRQYSSLYNKIKSQFGVNLSLSDIRSKIEYKKKEVS